MSPAHPASIWPMDDAASALSKAYIRRCQAARRDSGRTQQEVADLLGIPLERYKKYETRSELPITMLPRFASIVGRSIDHLVMGKETSRRRGPRQDTPAIAAKRRRTNPTP